MKRRSGCSGWLRFWAMATAFCSVWIGAGATAKETQRKQGAWVGAGETAKESQQKQRTRRQVTLKDYVQLARAKLGRKQESNKGNQPGHEQESGPPEKGSTRGRRGAAYNECPEEGKGKEPEGKQAAIPIVGLESKEAKGRTMVRTGRKERAKNLLTRTSSGQPQ